MKKKISLIVISLLLFLPAVKAQVTIGSHESPRKGSLLDLHQDGTTQKGLGFPRVELTSLNTLTIDLESEKQNYIGTMVYNTTDDNNIKEGIYCWDGNTWKLAIVVDSKGPDGSILKSNGNGTYGWSTVTFPDYQFHKPTNIKGFDAAKAQINEYTYKDIVYKDYPGQNLVWLPDTLKFKGKYVYTDTLNIQTDVSTKKFMLLGMTITTDKSCLDNNSPTVNTWEAITTEVFITKINPGGSLGTTKSIKKYRKVANVFLQGPLVSYFDLFSIISLNEADPTISKGDYQIKIHVKVDQHSLGRDPNFVVSGTFYKIALDDINLVVFEHE